MLIEIVIFVYKNLNRFLFSVDLLDFMEYVDKKQQKCDF